MAYNSFPYTNFHELNLDYLLNKSKKIEGNVQETADNVLRATQQADRSQQQATNSQNSATASAQSAAASSQSAVNSANSAAASAQSATEARAAAGDPKTFTAATQLTDTTKIYVYVGETGTYTYGHYYYYQAGSWHDGGVYGTWATDDALSDSSTNAVQNRVVNAAVSELKSDLREKSVSYISDVDDTLIGIHVKKLSRTSVELYGTNSTSGVRYLLFLNGGFQYVTSSVVPYKPFPAGVYKFVTNESVLPDDVYFNAIYTNLSEGIMVRNGKTAVLTQPFVPILKVPKDLSFGTENSPTIVTIDVVQLCVMDSNVLMPSGDNTDRTDDIVRFLAIYGECKLIDGDYYVSGINMPEKTTISGNGANTRVILSSSVGTGSAIKMANECSVKNISVLGSLEEIEFVQGDIDSIHLGTRHGILWQGEATGEPSTSENNTHFKGIVSGCRIAGFSGGGITCESTGYSSNSGLTVSDCNVSNCGAGINVSWWSEYNRFGELTVYKCYYGAINNGGNNAFVHCTFGRNEIAFYMNGQTDKCVLADGTAKTSINDGHGMAVGCTFNHNGLFESNAGYAIYARSVAAGFIFTGFQLHYGKLFLRLCSRIMFCGGNFGNSVEITCYSTNTYMFTSCFFHQSAELYPYDQNTGELITVFDSDGNLPRIKFINCYNSTFDPVTAQTLSNAA